MTARPLRYAGSLSLHVGIARRPPGPPDQPAHGRRTHLRRAPSPPGHTLTKPPGRTLTKPPGRTLTKPPGRTLTKPPGRTRARPPGLALA
ncbi:hypothetical protein [Actinoplanes subtropicus]|uniref:hypothetical protein n=1 Tax=Actinoplanes subtropicus TaxID=543632 RepID=UPI000A8486FE|nr:hypothetical protein [Actinoplanes subtropicus]